MKLLAGAGGGLFLLVTLLLAAALAAIGAVAPWLIPSPRTGEPLGAVADIPPDYLALYLSAARECPGLPWSVLAAVGKIETDHGRVTLPGVRAGTNAAGAAGPMQFLPATFAAVIARHRLPDGGSHPASLYDPHDAIWAAGYYLCDSGARDGRDIPAALYQYNHAGWYVHQVLDQAHRYATAAVPTPGGPSTPTAGIPDPATVAAAITYARAQRGKPYRWGGEGADGGFDCSGLTQAAYAAAGIALPRTADQQYHAGPQLPPTAPLLPGDLVFYRATPTGSITHVALYTGYGQILEAEETGHPVLTAPLPAAGYAGATRPATPRAAPS